MDLAPLRELLYDVLTIEDGNGSNGGGDVSATQNMGIALSNAVKKEGVNIIQLQSVVNVKVVKKITEALRFLDSHQHQLNEIQALAVEAEEVIETLALPPPDFLEDALSRRATLKDFVGIAEMEYTSEAVSRFGEAEAMRLLNVRKNKVEKAMEYAAEKQQREEVTP